MIKMLGLFVLAKYYIFSRVFNYGMWDLIISIKTSFQKLKYCYPIEMCVIFMSA